MSEKRARKLAKQRKKHAKREAHERRRQSQPVAPHASLSHPPLHVFPLGRVALSTLPANFLNRVSVGSASVSRPRPDTEHAFNAELAHFYATHGGIAGIHSGPDVTRVLGIILDRLTDDLRDVLGRLGSREAVEHLLDIDRQWGLVAQAFRAGRLTEEEAALYRQEGPQARRAIEFALEGMVALQPPEQATAPREDLVWLHDRLLLCAERMVVLADAHAQAGLLFPGAAKLDIDPYRQGDELRLELGPEAQAAYQRFEQVAIRDGHHTGPGFGFARANELVTKHLDPVFEEELGFTLTDAYQVAMKMIDQCRPPPGPGFGVNFVSLALVLSGLAAELTRTELEIEHMLSAWILSKEGLEREDRVIWRSRQKNRLIRRPFMRLPHPTGDHICFTREYATTALNFTIDDLVFSRLPPEWENKRILGALQRGARLIDREWERAVQADLEARGLSVVTGVKVLRTKAGRVKVPDEIGEIDLLGIARDLSFMFVGEVKRVGRAVWAPEFAEDKAKFITGNKDYLNKFLKKVAWIDQHWQDVAEHMVLEKRITQALTTKPPLKTAMVTEWESIAQVFTDQTTIISKRRLIEHYDASKEWLFTATVVP